MTINGLITALTTPFSYDNIDVQALQQHVMLLEPYVSGFVIGGTTGESGNISDDELVGMVQATNAVAGDKTIIVGYWRETIFDAITSSKKLQHYADLLLVPLPRELFASSDAAIEEFYSQIAKTVSIPILMYNFPARCEQRAISTELALRIAEKNSNIIGVKDSSSDAKLAKDLIAENTALQPILGNDRFLYEILELMQEHKSKYPTASISGASSIPEIAKVESLIYQLFSAGQHAQAKLMQQNLIVEYFNNWQGLAAQLGGEAPIIKNLINSQLSIYPTIVRPPLKQIEREE